MNAITAIKPIKNIKYNFLYQYNNFISKKKNVTNKTSQDESNDKADNKKSNQNSQIIKEREGNFLCVYYVNDEGDKTLISKTPFKDKDNNCQLLSADSKSSASVNPIFSNKSVINTRTADSNYNQQLLQSQNSNNDIQNLIKDLI